MSIKIYSVTEVLGLYQDFSKAPPDKLQHAAARGTEVHRHCAGIALGLWLPEPSQEARGYIESFRQWFDAMVEEVVSAEETLTNAEMGFRGHPDLILRLVNMPGLSIIDNKTPLTLQRTWAGQLAAYEMLAKGKYGNDAIKRCGSLRLSPEGKTARMEWYPRDGKAFSMFLQALNALRYFKGE